MSFRDWLIPQDNVFFDLFEKPAAITHKAALHLCSMIEHFDDVKNMCHLMKSYEHEGDVVSHEIYQLLNKSFVTPIEPDEISRLAASMDDVLDAIDDASRKMFFYDIGVTDTYMLESAKIIIQQTEQIEKAISATRTMNQPAIVDECCIEINRLENLADDVLAVSLQELFKTTDAIKIVKMKDVYETLEATTDRCEDVANILGDIAIKHS